MSGSPQEEHQQSEFDEEEHNLEQQQQHQQFEHLRVQQQPVINESGCKHLIF
jgi:hypothetical protein